ncbi:tetratricopeptide repeat protein [Sphingobacterium composti Ten et al. 2007 non Yoo et al. 2007]|uniref:tetratricopeptide repeat protein n=1 Tax=Sphingobacterium composti TaxID=363260 RepID=UPI00135CE56F|nr:tetratricopeptide repeat protein [Sphingobacterium composti Ten et al. 2007 non Yoo et al. 2007]
MSTNINSTDQKGSFFQDNQKSLLFILGAVVVLILLYIGYQKLYLAPRAETAADAMYQAEEYVLIDSLQKKAIEGDGSFTGLKEIADEYSNTPSANIANAYLGGLYLREGNFQEAINYLKKYSDTGSEILDPLVVGLIGDAYSDSHDYKNAADYYQKAVGKSKNSYTTPLFLKKLGLVYEQLNEYKKAEEAYQRIKTDFPQSAEASTIDGPLARVQAKQ